MNEWTFHSIKWCDIERNPVNFFCIHEPLTHQSNIHKINGLKIIIVFEFIYFVPLKYQTQIILALQIDKPLDLCTMHVNNDHSF